MADYARWWENHSNLVTLVSWMAESGNYSASDVAYAVEKPYKYTDEFLLATGTIAAAQE